MRFQIVDAFTDSLFGGNPAGVVFIPEGADFPDDETMRKTAAELRYSETAFLKKVGDKEYHTRYFTPAAEVDLCGHATIGSSFALLHDGEIAAGDTVRFNTMAGPIDIIVDSDSILMDMGDPVSYGEMKDGGGVEVYHVLGLEAHGQDIYEADEKIRLKPQKVSTGLIDIITPVRNIEELDKIDPDFTALSELSEKQKVVGAHAFTINTDDGFIHARNFAPLYDIDEEAATGTSNGALAFYLYSYGIIEPDKVYTVIQGEKMGRPSKISFQVKLIGGEPKIKVGGLAVTLAEGEIAL